jgi:hypothetical protein
LIAISIWADAVDLIHMGRAFESALFSALEKRVPGQEVVLESVGDAVLPSVKTGNPALTRLAYTSTLAALIRISSSRSPFDNPNLLGL